MAEHQLPKLNTRVRFPSSAPDLAGKFAVLPGGGGVLTVRPTAHAGEQRRGTSALLQTESIAEAVQLLSASTGGRDCVKFGVFEQ
jgi:hypothetical protein